jgi:agmatine deiminase
MTAHEPGIVLEGGSIDVNGAGLLLATEECLLSPIQARNPGLGREQLEAIFAEYLGIHRTIWLAKGIDGDDTHGHIDDVARFVNADTVVTVIDDPILNESGLNIVTLPMPEPVYFNRQRLPASYANFYIANGLVLVPTFNDPADRVALNTLADLFPGREVVGMACTDLVLGLGTLHCMTMQQPF